MEKLVLSLKEVAAPINKSHRSLERMVDADGVIDLGVGTIKTVKLGGSRVVPTHEFERFLRAAGIVITEPTAVPEPTPEPACRGRKRQSAMVKGGAR
ncbi:MAG: hypothetical protein M0Z99_19665 [Betaproteobacteria bacterium]|nr:hypothetical protein [Betaproteobacteria bacterium]